MDGKNPQKNQERDGPNQAILDQSMHSNLYSTRSCGSWDIGIGFRGPAELEVILKSYPPALRTRWTPQDNVGL